LRLLPLWLVTFLISSPAVAGVVWRGDFETGDRSQYTSAQMVSADRLQVVTSPVTQGRYALKATVKQGDDPINSSGNRNELVHDVRETSGSEYYYRWSVMFAPDFPSARTWQVFTQWHHDGSSGSPPVEFFVYGEEIRLTMNDSVTPWSMPLTRGVWHEFIFHVKWSADPKVGFIELWHNREQVLAKRNMATMYAGYNVYLKLGLYRSDTVSQTGVVYHDGFIQATQLADVLPPPPPSPAPDAGTPDAGTTPPASDAGTPTGGDSTPGSETTSPGGSPGTVDPGVGSSPDTGSVDAVQYGCSTGGSPLAAMALLALFGVLRLRRQR
jgi:MYXO-CTERM domain-containing protein